MVVEVRLFAILRERAGTSSVSLELDEGATVQQAVDTLAHDHGLGEVINRMQVAKAVNREYASNDSTLHEGDELALIPPVSGGEKTRADADRSPHSSTEHDGKVDTTAAPDAAEKFKELVSKEMPPPAYTDLLGSRPLDAEPGHVRMEFQATEQLLNPMGAVQGGFLTAMLDETMGPAAISALGPGQGVPTLELKVSFIRPARPGRFVADARVVHLGKSVVFLESTLVADDGTLIATATATARIVPLEKPNG
jgi:molybdopterin converting factor subunit 1